MCPTYEPTSMSCTCALFVSAPLCKEASQLPGELAAYNDGKPQFSSRPGVPWKCLTTNQRQCPGSRLRSVWGVYAASWKDVHVFMSNGDTSVLCFDAQQLRKWPRTGDLELCHTSEYLEGFLGGEVEGLVGGPMVRRTWSLRLAVRKKGLRRRPAHGTQWPMTSQLFFRQTWAVSRTGFAST